MAGRTKRFWLAEKIILQAGLAKFCSTIIFNNMFIFSFAFSLSFLGYWEFILIVWQVEKVWKVPSQGQCLTGCKESRLPLGQQGGWSIFMRRHNHLSFIGISNPVMCCFLMIMWPRLLTSTYPIRPQTWLLVYILHVFLAPSDTMHLSKLL